MKYKPEEILAGRRLSESNDTVLPSEALEELRRRYGPERIVPPLEEPPPLLPRVQQPPPLRPQVQPPPLASSGETPPDAAPQYSGLIGAGLGLVAVLALVALLFGVLSRPSGHPMPAQPTLESQKPASEPFEQSGTGVQPLPSAAVAAPPAPVVVVPAPAVVVSSPTPTVNEPGWNPNPPASALLPTQPRVSAPRADLVLYKRWQGNGVYLLTDSTGRPVKTLADPAPRAELVSIPVGGQISIPLPFGETRLCTFRGVVPSFDALPGSGAPNDFWIARDTSIPWIWVADGRNGLGVWIDP